MAWPLAARAQQPDRIRQVGVFVGLASSADDPIARETVRPFSEAMQAAGWLLRRSVKTKALELRLILSRKVKAKGK